MENGDKELLLRIDERTSQLTVDIERIHTLLADRYVVQEEFRPLRNLIYGIVALIMTSVFGSLVALLFKSSQFFTH